MSKIRWIAIGLAVLLAGIFALNYSMNAGVVQELHDDPDGERARRVMLLTLPSGKQIPVNYLREGAHVYAGADGPWWRPLRGDGASVELLVMGEKLRGTAHAVEGDPARTDAVFERLRPAVPAWLPRWADAVLVEIELESK